VISTRLPESAILVPQALPLKPPNTCEWMTPGRAQAASSPAGSGTIGMCSVTRSPALSRRSPQQRRELVHPVVRSR
jgi:hypothetical protein